MHSNIESEALTAARILDNARDFRLWEATHAGLMHKVADAGGAQAQRAALLNASLSLIHTKALFEYLRNARVRGVALSKLLRHFYGSRELGGALINEHATYFRSTASFMCSNHIGTHLLFGELFGEPLQIYEDMYNEYFAHYCDAVVTDDPDRTAWLAPLSTTLKTKVREWRSALTAMTVSQSGIWRSPDELTQLNRQSNSGR